MVLWGARQWKLYNIFLHLRPQLKKELILNSFLILKIIKHI
jgi:hypothetical protein